VLELTPDQEALKKRVTDAYEAAEKLHARYRDRWNRYYQFWRSYNDAANQQASRRPRDWDAPTQHWATREFGSSLFIPIVFSTIETILPRAIANRPRMLVEPRPRGPLPPELIGRMEDNAENHRLLIDSQQSNGEFNYDLVLQDVAKDGFIYGLGPQKTYWKRSTRQAVQVVPHVYTGEPCYQECRETTFDDPIAESIDPFNFFWDPAADSIATCDFIIHRQWRNAAYVSKMLQSGDWGGCPGLTMEDIGQPGGRAAFETTLTERDKAQGLSGGSVSMSNLYEVWEFHDGAEVITVLDRKWPVRRITNPLWHGELPFQVFRPTADTHRFVGVSEVDPLEDLNIEMNTLRSQRRDNVALKMMQTFFYAEAFVDPADMKWGPGVLIPVEAGVDPKDVIFPVQVGDIPFSGYREEESLMGDVDRTSGLSDASKGADPSGGLSSTATGAQLMEASASQRIALKARRLTMEVVVPTCRQWIAMNQRNILERPMRKPVLPTPEEPERKWAQVVLGPAETAGEFLVFPEGGQDANDNPVAQQAKAQMLINLFRGDQNVDQRELPLYALRLMGVPNPHALLTAQTGPDEASILKRALDNLQKMGFPPDVIAHAVQAAQGDPSLQDPGQQQQQLPAGPPVAA
jgi:hypothetical protein